MLTTNHPKRPVKEKDKHLRFAHFRSENRVAFSPDRPEAGSRHGSAAEDEAARFAHLCFVAAEVRRISVEVDGATFHGTLGLPEEGRTDFPFVPPAYDDGTLPQPTRPRCILRYKIDGSDCSAESTVRMGPDGAAWRIAAPRVIDIGDHRLSARHYTPYGWTFEPKGRAPVALVGHLKVADVSTTGAALLFGDDLDLQPGDTLAGELVSPKGERFRVLVELRNLHEDHGHTVGGVEFQGMGFDNVARLAATIRRLPRE